MDEKAIGHGYHYRIDFASGLQSLYVKTLADIGEVMRELYPNEKNWSAYKLT